MVKQKDKNGSEQDPLVRALGTYGACPCDVDNINALNRSSYSIEFWQILRNSVPLSLTLLMQTMISSVSLLFVGRLGSLVLGAVTMANVVFTATSVVFLGLATCLDTLCPQAYGAGHYALVGLYFQKCVAISAVAALPVSSVWLFSKPLIGLLAKDAEVVHIASRYLKCMVGCVPGYIVFECGKKYLQAQGDFLSAQLILLISFPFSALANYILVGSLGYMGAPLASSLTYTLMGILLACVMLRKRTCWHAFSWKRTMQGWDPLIRLAGPGIIMIEAEFLAFESLTLLAARFDTTELASQAVAASVQSITFQIPFAVSIAASNRISTHVGRGNVHDCVMATRTSLLCMGPLVSLLNIGGLLLGRFRVCSMFTRDPAVVKRAAHLLCVVAVNQLWDVYNVLAAGCLRAQGRQRLGGYLNLIAYYLFGIPLALYLGFGRDWQAFGFWIGLGSGIFALSASEVFCVYKSDWPRIILDSQKLHIHN
ncbi:uncharacterized protein ZBAI_04583 [Zygosaccharomyces bailii ISA1307]|nr:uncharacterized protein ZBAI_04583 [Zygosaccharomyces bailii ISA1307]